MNSVTTDSRWITGPEFAAERRRLLDWGYDYNSPEYQELQRRVSERNAYLWETYARPLLLEHPGWWIAVSLDGEVLLADRELEAMKQGRARFGAGNYLLARLDESRGAGQLGPRGSE